MITNKHDLVNEQTSPLFRIMNIYNADSDNKKFANNICAFHIGNGLILSVAHNLRVNTIPETIDENQYQSEIINKINPNLVGLFNQKYILSPISGKRHYDNPPSPHSIIEMNAIMAELNRIKFDNRWITQVQKGICKQFLVIEFRKNSFYNDDALTALFNPKMRFSVPEDKRHTFLLEVELITPFYESDIAIYRIINTNKEIIKRLPAIELDFNLLDDDNQKLFCLQSAPVANLGRLLNDAKMEGILDQWSPFGDLIDGNYIMEGSRYMIKGYFRFGSSGAPYIVYDVESGSYKANAIQSEACPIQLSIVGNREGNYQYINAIASPLKNVERAIAQQLEIEEHLLA